jgi:hypothetical protein
MSNSILSGAAAATMANGTLILAILGGSAYIGACEARATTHGQCDSQWVGGLAMMGIGGAGRAGWGAGFNTLNPNLRSPEAPSGSQAPSPVASVRRKVEDLAVDAVSDQVKALLARGGRTDG